MKHAPGFLKLVQSVMPRVQEISAEEVAALMHSSPLRGQGIIIIDVREDHEWEKGHIEGAVHMGRGILERDIETKIPDKQAKLVLYCGGGYRSALSADSLQQMGYTNVFSLAEGWRGWCERGFYRT